MDCQTGGQGAFSVADCLEYADETRAIVINEKALTEIPRLLSEYFEFDSVCLIADENTLKAAGRNVTEILEGAKIKISGIQIFPGLPRLHADYSHAVFLREWISCLGGRQIPVAVGAGTINDLVKRASSELKLPYLCIPTAASVDGYTPSGASLLMDGFKQTAACAAPRALAADTALIAKAPAYLASSGFGDLAGKIIAGTDWIIAEKAGAAGAPGAPAIEPVSWGMVQNGLMDTLKASQSAVNGDSWAVNKLLNALSVTGFAIQYYKNSRPVSCSEHLFSHVWEMEDLSCNGVPVTHGHKVGIGTLACTAFTEIFFADPKGPPAVSKSYKRPGRRQRQAEVSRAFSNSRACDMAIAASMEKLMDEKKAETVNQAFRDCWKEIRSRVLDRLLPYGELKTLLAGAQCPVKPQAVGLSRTEAIATARRAQMIRNKYGILDIAWDMGNFEVILDKLSKSRIYL